MNLRGINMKEDKVKNSKGFKIFIIIFLLVSMIFLKEENQNKIISFIDDIKGNEKVLELNNAFKDDDILNLHTYDDIIVTWKDNKLSYKKLDGRLILEKQFNFEEPFIHYGDKYIFIMDKSTGDIYSLDKKGETRNRLELKKEIFNLKDSNGNLIYHTKGDSVEGITILDNKGVLIGNQSYKNKNILAYASNKKGNINIVSILDFEENNLKSIIYSYGEDNEKLDTLEIKGEIVIYLDITSNDEIIAITDRTLYLIKDGKVIWSKKFDSIKDIYVEEKIYILYNNYLESIDFQGRTEIKLSFGDRYKKIVPFDNKILLYGDNNLTLINGDKEILKYKGNISKVLPSKRQLVIWGDGEIRIYKISNKDEKR